MSTDSSDPTQLPPGQIRTLKFPVVGEKSPSAQALDLEAWRLVVDGLVARPRTFTWPEFLALPQEERHVDIHCVTGWSHLGTSFTGVPLAHVLDMVEPDPAARFVRFEAYSERKHDTSLPLVLARRDTWLVHRRGGEPLPPENGYPLRTLTPSRYFYKSLKWVHRIELMAEDRLGFWERDSNYHNVGDPWTGDQRFTSGSLEPAKVERFKTATSFDRYRKPRKVLLGLDLRGWSPESRDLSELELKNCDLRGADLAGCDLRRANLSLSRLGGADLRGADLRHADLEGVDFSGGDRPTDLRDADLRHTQCSATRFVASDGTGGARVEGLRWDDVHGLVESQAAYLRAQAG